MDISSLPSIEYSATVASPLVNGEAKLSITENGLAVTALFSATEIPFCEMNALNLNNYVVNLATDGGLYSFSRLGNWCQPFYDALYEAYNQTVLRALFTQGTPLATAAGPYHYSEFGTSAGGQAPVRVYENSVCVLPPDLGARRIPLCFVNGLDKADFGLTLRIDSPLGGAAPGSAAESYTFSKLGYDTAPFTQAVETQIRKLREKTLAVVREIAPSLTAAQAAGIALLLPEGAAAPMGRLAAVAPAFVAAAEEKIAKTRAAESVQFFRSFCDPAEMYLGFMPYAPFPAATEAGGLGNLLEDPSALAGGFGALTDVLGALSDSGETSADEVPDPYLFWLIAPSADKRSCAVEFAVPQNDSAATFVYRCDSGFALFASRLNRALEAIAFKREVIRLSQEDLRKPENSVYYMASKRTVSLRFVRSCFLGRAIHRGPESWKKQLLELLGAQ